MKKTLITLAVAAATIFTFSSCQQESLDNQSKDDVRIITAVFENAPTRTTLNDDGITPEWAAGDVIRILNEISYQDVPLTAGDFTDNKITFTTDLQGTLYAVYPASVTTMESCPDGDVTFNILASQEGTFASANICVAKSSEEDDTNKDNLIFRNATAVLKITTPADVIKVQVAAANPIAGTVTASFDGTAVSLATSDLDNNSVSVNGSQVPSDNIFYLAVAPVATGSTTVTCSTLAMKGSTTKGGKDLRKNVIYSMDLSGMELNEDACVAAGTMITMENGEQKAVEEIEIGDKIRTVDHKSGTVSSASVCFVWKTENASDAFTLTFESGVEVTVIQEHGFYDQDEQKYVFINANNAKDYIGHHFYDADNGCWLELKSCTLLNKTVDAYAIITSKHLNHLSNGMLSMCDGTVKFLGLANMFEYDSQLMFDADKMAADIAWYGLTPLEKILEYKGFTEADYYDYNLQYLNVAIGKGLTSWDYVKALSDYCEAY